MQIARSFRSAALVLSLALLALAAVACLPQRAFAANKVITSADKGSAIHLKLGERFEVRLKSNPSTGFMWYVEKESTPLVKLVHQSQVNIEDESENQPFGQPVYQIFTFEARRSGGGVLLLHYVRSWEKPTPDDEQFQIHVVVE